jgi:hypothetical protein
VDSLKKYRKIVESVQGFNYRKDAYEMLKFTGSMRLINDRQMLLDIMTCYSDLADIKDGFDLFLNQKISLLNQTLNISDNFNFIDLREPVFIGLYHYFHNDPGIRPSIEEYKKHIEKTLEKL